jgi:hypothetical protein
MSEVASISSIRSDTEPSIETGNPARAPTADFVSNATIVARIGKCRHHEYTLHCDACPLDFKLALMRKFYPKPL